MSAATRVPDPARRSRRSHRAILDATFELVARKGYAKVTIEGIAAAAKVGKPTIYRWWPSKGALALDAVIDRIGHALDFPDTGDITADLVQQITEVVTLFSSDVGVLLRGVIAEGQSDPDVAAAVRDRFIEPRIRACRQRLDTAVTAGQLRAGVSTRSMVESLYGAVYYRLLLGTDALTAADVPAMVDNVIIGLGTGGGRPSPR
ncbi:TetR/AcrR family transcriptional regulator [Spirillospora sp. CA-142024]|uniref:TetR/AcrR family transcriptional regulator n=1 Tax=Spirillospora sp. CA-142024 TaxID=3240036 RepID=UPI003D90F1A0